MSKREKAEKAARLERWEGWARWERRGRRASAGMAGIKESDWEPGVWNMSDTHAAKSLPTIRVRVVRVDDEPVRFSAERLEQSRQFEEPWVLCRVSLPQFCAVYPRTPGFERSTLGLGRNQEEVHTGGWPRIRFTVLRAPEEIVVFGARCEAQSVLLQYRLEPGPENARFVVDSAVVVAVPAPKASFGVPAAAAPTAWTARLVVGIGH